MLVVTFGLLTFLFTNVVPKIAVIFEENGQELPMITQIVVGTSGFFIDYWLAIGIAAVGGFILFRGWKATEGGGAQWDALVLKLPVIGRLTRLIATSRFTRTLSTLLNGGVPMLSAMDIVRNVVGNYVLAAAIDDARENISEGESIAGPLKKSQQFPPLVIHMINIGEKTGELENMLDLVSTSYDFEVKNSIDGLTSAMNPILIVILGGVITLIVFAIMMPMFDMMDNIG
jgi:general secretion pathway protein F